MLETVAGSCVIYLDCLTFYAGAKATRDAALARVAVLEEALQPFADIADRFEGSLQ